MANSLALVTGVACLNAGVGGQRSPRSAEGAMHDDGEAHAER